MQQECNGCSLLSVSSHWLPQSYVTAAVINISRSLSLSLLFSSYNLDVVHWSAEEQELCSWLSQSIFSPFYPTLFNPPPPPSLPPPLSLSLSLPLPLSFFLMDFVYILYICCSVLVDNLVFVTLLSVSCFYCLPCVILQQVSCTMINKEYLILSYIALFCLSLFAAAVSSIILSLNLALSLSHSHGLSLYCSSMLIYSSSGSPVFKGA